MNEMRKPALPAQMGYGQRIRKSPCFEATVRAGASGWSVSNHVYMPLWYESPEADYRQLVEHAGLWDVSGEGQVQIDGADGSRQATAADLPFVPNRTR